jgi:DNA-directed RNA polymerase specialized sigma24 family protein
MDKDAIAQHHKMFYHVLWSDKFTGKKIRAVRDKVCLLCEYLHGYNYTEGTESAKADYINQTKELVFDELTYNYITRRHYDKYDGKHSVSTWIATYIYNNINNILRKHKPRAVDPYKGIDDRSDIFDEAYVNYRLPLEDYWDSVYMRDPTLNPEHILIGRELLGMVLAYFGELDTQVMLGIRSSEEVALAQRLRVDSYNKRLYRRKLMFKEQLERIGYLN